MKYVEVSDREIKTFALVDLCILILNNEGAGFSMMNVEWEQIYLPHLKTTRFYYQNNK